MKLLEDQEDYFAMNGQRSTLTGEDTEEFCKTYSVYYEKTLEESGFDLFTSILHGETLPRALSELVNSVLLADAGRRNWHRLARQLTVEAKRQWLDQLLSKERSSSLTCSLPALS